MTQSIANAPYTGLVIGYKTSWNIFSHDAFVVVNIKDTKVNVRIDSRQLKYVEKEYPAGSKVFLRLDGNKWSIVSMPSSEDLYTPEEDVSYMDALANA